MLRLEVRQHERGDAADLLLDTADLARLHVALAPEHGTGPRYDAQQMARIDR